MGRIGFVRLSRRRGLAAGVLLLVVAAALVAARVALADSWTIDNSTTTNDLYGVSCVTDTNCWAVGESGKLLETTDGSTWVSKSSGTGQLLYGDLCVGELRSPPVPLDAGLRPMLRLQAANSMRLVGAHPPTLRIGAHPSTLVFLARGPGPFRLELAPAQEPSSQMTLAQLMPARRSEPLAVSK